jgi:hypothetical protein
MDPVPNSEGTEKASVPQTPEPPPETPVAAAESPATPPDKAKPGPAAAIKEWSEAISALCKAVLFGLAIVLVGSVSAVAIWRHEHTRARSVVVEVSPEADTALKAVGADIDLRLALSDAVNDRVAAVQQIIALQGLALVAGGSQADAVSFRPFGFNVSTDDMTRVVDLIFGRPFTPTIRLDVRCTTGACTQSGASDTRLIATFIGENGSRFVSYRLIPGDRTITRSLHQSMESIADRVLEWNEPLIASVWFLNRPDTQIHFQDQYYPDLIRAEGAAVASRAQKDAGCLPDLVTGGSLIARGELDHGVAAAQRAAVGVSELCKVQAQTNIIYALTGWALCSPDAKTRNYAREQILQADQRLAELHATRKSVGDLHYYRIPMANLAVGVMRTLEKAGPANQPVSCLRNLAPRTVPGSTAAVELEALIAQARKALPPDAHMQNPHQALDLLFAAMRAGIPRDDIQARLHVGKLLLDATHQNETRDSHPRALFMLEGKLAMEMGGAAFRALPDPDPRIIAELADGPSPDAHKTDAEPEQILLNAYYQNIFTAAIAFQNASDTTGLQSLLEPVSEIEALTLLGDARYAANQTDSASAEYRHAGEKFIADDEPVEEVLPVIGTLARWTFLQADTGRCNPGAAPDPAWMAWWARLGETPPDACQLVKPAEADDPFAAMTKMPQMIRRDSVEPDKAADPSAAMTTIVQMIRRDLSTCFIPAAAPAAADLDSRHRQETLRRLDTFECLNTTGLFDLQATFQSSEVLDQEIWRALRGARASSL